MCEAITGCAECEFKDFATQPKDDIGNFSKGCTIKPIEDLHRNIGVKARQNYNNNVPRAGRWHVTQTANIIEEMGHRQPEPTAEDNRERGLHGHVIA